MRVVQWAVTDLDALPGEFGIKPSQSTLWTKKRMKRRLVSNTESVKQTTISIGFNVEVANSLCGYARLLHLDITIWTMAFAHWTCVRFYFGLISKSGHRFSLETSNVCLFLRYSHFVLYITHSYISHSTACQLPERMTREVRNGARIAVIEPACLS